MPIRTGRVRLRVLTGWSLELRAFAFLVFLLDFSRLVKVKQSSKRCAPTLLGVWTRIVWTMSGSCCGLRRSWTRSCRGIRAGCSRSRPQYQTRNHHQRNRDRTTAKGLAGVERIDVGVTLAHACLLCGRRGFARGCRGSWPQYSAGAAAVMLNRAASAKRACKRCSRGVSVGMLPACAARLLRSLCRGSLICGREVQHDCKGARHAHEIPCRLRPPNRRCDR